MRTIRLFAAIVLTGSLLVAAGASSDAALSTDPGSKNLRTWHTTVMKDEMFSAYGKIPSTDAVRPVKLQYKSGSTWRTWATTSSDHEGYFSFYTSTAKTYSFRFYAPRTSAEATVIGYSKKITVAPQTGSAVVVPSEKCTGDSNTTIQVFAHFAPGRNGRLVRLTSAGDTFDGSTDPAGNTILTDTAAPVTLGVHYVTVRASSYFGAAAKTVTAKYTVVQCLE